MEIVRIGVLSHAHGHSNVYCGKMQEFDDVELVACWDDNEQRGREAASNFGMEYRPEADAIITDPQIDALIITTETNRHAAFVERAAEAGKAILCQKPLATTLADCDRIIEAVQRTGVKFSMAFQMRHDPVNRIRTTKLCTHRRSPVHTDSGDGCRGTTRNHIQPVHVATGGHFQPETAGRGCSPDPIYIGNRRHRHRTTDGRLYPSISASGHPVFLWHETLCARPHGRRPESITPCDPWPVTCN